MIHLDIRLVHHGVNSIKIFSDDLQSCHGPAKSALTTNPGDARFLPLADTFAATRARIRRRKMLLNSERMLFARFVGRQPATFRCLRSLRMILTLVMIRNIELLFIITEML